MNGKIEAKVFYLQKLREKTEIDIKLSDANLELLEKNAAKLLRQLEEIQTAKTEWEGSKKEAEDKLRDPDPTIKRWLEADFRREMSLRRRGGDPEMAERLGRPVYGLLTKNKNRRKVSIPKLQRDGERTWYSSEETEICDRRDNQAAYSEWTAYMEKGLAIDPAWTFDKLFLEIERFFAAAPDLEKYGSPYTVFEKSGDLYQPAAGM